MTNDADMSGWTDLLHSSTKLLEQATPSVQFPPLQRNLDQLEVLSKKLKAKTLRAEDPSESVAATRLLAREGINAEQLARDLKSFEIKTTDDVFPSDATTVEEYLQQVREKAMISAIQGAQKDNLRSFNRYMMKVSEEDWKKEKRDFLQSLSRISMLPRTNFGELGAKDASQGQLVPISSPHIQSQARGMEVERLIDKPISEKKATLYAEVVKRLNTARERGLPFKPASAFKSAYESLGFEAPSGKSVTVHKIWNLVQSLVEGDADSRRNVSKRMCLVIGSRRHLELGHEKYIMDTIQNHPAKAMLGGAFGNLQKIQAFLRVRLRDYGLLDFDAHDARRHPPVDTTWQQIYFCLRTGYYDEARNIAASSRVSQHFAAQLTEWISSGGSVSAETAGAACEECEKLWRMVDRGGRSAYDKKRLLLQAVISGSQRQIDRILRELPNMFNTIEDFLWFNLASLRDLPGESASIILDDGFMPYSLDDLQSYLNKFEPSYYTKNGKDPLVYPYVLLLTIQLLPAINFMAKEAGDDGYNIDAIHISIVLADHGVFSEGSAAGLKIRITDSVMEVPHKIRQYGAEYLRLGNLVAALEYYAQAASAVGGGEPSWSGRGSVDQQRQRNLMLKQLFLDLLLRDGGILLLLGSTGSGEEGQLRRYFPDAKERHQFLVEASRHCFDAGLYERSIEIQKRIGAFSSALDTINKCLSDAICALSRGALDGESQIAGLLLSGNEILDTFKRYNDISFQERDYVMEQQIVLRQLEAILSVHKWVRLGRHADALQEIFRLPTLPLDPRLPDHSNEALRKLSPHVVPCVPGILRAALTCLDNVADTDGSLSSMRSRIANILASNLHRNWPRDLYERVARSL